VGRPEPKQLWDGRSPSSCGTAGAQAVVGRPEPKIFRWWSRSLKYGFPFNRHSLWSNPSVPIIQCFFSVFWTKSFWSRSRSQELVDAWSRNPKFVSRLHSPGVEFVLHNEAPPAFKLTMVEQAASSLWPCSRRGHVPGSTYSQRGSNRFNNLRLCVCR